MGSIVAITVSCFAKLTAIIIYSWVQILLLLGGCWKRQQLPECLLLSRKPMLKLLIAYWNMFIIIVVCTWKFPLCLRMSVCMVVAFLQWHLWLPAHTEHLSSKDNLCRARRRCRDQRRCLECTLSLQMCNASSARVYAVINVCSVCFYFHAK